MPSYFTGNPVPADACWILLKQSPVTPIEWATPGYPQHEFPVCFGGQSTDPNEQNTQQSPVFGLNISRHFGHS